MSAPRPTRPPRVRLGSVKDPTPSSLSKAGQISRPRLQGPPKCCEAPDYLDSDGTRACMNCGTVLTESEIVSEVTFGENSNGAAVVQGAFVGDNQRHAKTMGPAFRRNGGTTDSREQTEQKGKAEIHKISSAVRILNASIDDQAFGIYKLAIGNNFIQGRRVRTVAAVCLYIACRRKPGNTVLLMDFAAELQMNVWALGDVYKALKDELWFGEPATASGVPAVLEVEPLLDKFASKLEFGDDTRQVATDAARILRRMKRDWMVEGRQPAGLCGACLILAARQNNFRRTIREVVYVVKVCDQTIFQRLIEFKRTQAANLTIEQFRKMGHRLKVKGEPPAVYKRREKEDRDDERKKRRASEMSRDSSEVPADDTQPGASRTPPATDPATGRASSSPAVQPTSETLRRDTEGFLIPNIPVDRALLEASNIAHSEFLAGENAEAPEKPAKKRRKKERKAPIVIPEEDLEIEEDLEEEIENILNERETDDAATLARAERLASALRGPSTVSEEEDLDEHEFDDDPEVSNCVLSPAEVQLRERIWVTVNEDWLRERQAKMLKASMEQATGGPKKKQQRRKHSQMGDGSVLGGSPASSTAEAVKAMITKRTKGFSKFINYDNLNALYKTSKEDDTSGATSTASSPPADAAASPASQWIVPSRSPSTSVNSTPSQPSISLPRGTRPSSLSPSRGLEPKQVTPPSTIEVIEALDDEAEVPEEEPVEDEDEDDEEDEMEEDEVVAETTVFDQLQEPEYDEDYGYEDEEY